MTINNTRWLAGHAAYDRGDPCPWGDESARRGWLAARDTAAGQAYADRLADLADAEALYPAAGGLPFGFLPGADA